MSVMSRSSSIATPRCRQTGLARRSLLIGLGLVAAVALALLLGIFLGGRMQSTDTAHDAPAEPVETKEPTFVKVSPMTVNLAGERQVLYVGVSVQVPDEASADRLNAHMPAVRNRLLLTLSDRDAGQLVTADGKQQIAEILAEALAKPYGTSDTPVPIGSVLFTDFVVQ